jgi:glutamate--cysteine ligase
MTAAAQLDPFARFVRERLFVAQAVEERRIGLEVEMLPFLAESGAPCPLESDGEGGLSTLPFVRRYGESRGWREHRSPKGAPYFALPNGVTLTFEPGGQLELCTSARSAIGVLIADTRRVLADLRAAAADAGIELASVGIDPHNDVAAVPLQLRSERYVKMTRYFDSIGPSGVRMMRQTAATQVSLDAGSDPAGRWRLLADATPYLTAMFANSPRYAGEDSGFRSFRARCWRLLDPSRTGVPHPELPAREAYARFAFDAVDMTRTTPNGEYRPFADWAADGHWNEAQWENHLSTLFPEVRPRGHLEVRSIDAVPPEVLAAPVVLLAGLAYDDTAAAEARRLLPPADEDMLNGAARCSLRDSGIAMTASALVAVGLRGARALGEQVIGGAELERAEDFFGRWTLRGRSPADDR